MLRKLEKFLYQRAENIIMIWPRTEEYVARYGIPANKIVWIPHLADLTRYNDLKPYDGTIGDQFTVMYLGTFNNSTATWIVPEAAKLLEDRGASNIRFMLVGGGATKDALIRACARLSLHNVVFPGLVPKKDIAAVMGEADAFLVTLKNVPLLKYGISLNKACDYLASGRPTIFAGTPSYDPVKEAKAGISVPAEDPKSLADGIASLMALTSAERVQMGRNGREYLQRVHGLEVLADRLERTLLGSGKCDPEPSAPVGIAETEATPV
jgi:glycosyltransferase involved in cell wall biosynthesis